jgi:hypothetical protein
MDEGILSGKTYEQVKRQLLGQHSDPDTEKGNHNQAENVAGIVAIDSNSSGTHLQYL